ncbi:hypothetical protein [Lyngbya confervoides]|uniref:Uncharacterized protein n=1 Tax=Lyngbya confervoides BDU141951 TaxID=1574623 RepID=A0ABD4SY64_9CYAN|nr:hypothetical protein [Lyngbya confervoides]MCM1981289.1 hypothetical protein [Lyngbya confervoides BDU141951]
MGLVVEQRRLFLGDQSQIDNNQNLRAAADLIGADIQQAGERIELGATLPIVQVRAGSSSTDPDTLVLQRKLISDELSLCDNVTATDKQLKVADSATGCHFSDGNTDKLTDSLGQFKAYRCSLDSGKTSCNRGQDDATSAEILIESSCDNECVFGYIHNPDTKEGEFFLYTDEVYQESSGTQNYLKVIPLGPGNQWQRSYPLSANPQIYILEEQQYSLCNGVLEKTSNRQPENSFNCSYSSSGSQPARLVNNLKNLQFRVQTTSGWQSSFNENLTTLTDFTTIKSIEVSLETQPSDRINTASKTLLLSTEFFPRNAQSEF